MKKNFQREMNALEGVFEFIDDFLMSQGASENIAFSLRLAVEELFTNLIRHNIKRHPAEMRDITLSIEKSSNQFIVRLWDFDVEPFTVPQREDIDIDRPLHERRIGGLGVHLVRNIVDKLTYEFKDDNLCVTIVKKLEKGDV